MFYKNTGLLVAAYCRNGKKGKTEISPSINCTGNCSMYIPNIYLAAKLDKRTGSMYILPGLRTKNEPTSLEEPVFCSQTQVKVLFRGLGTIVEPTCMYVFLPT